jgi:hypothetical protein
VSGSDSNPATITFTEAPGVGAEIRFCYFTDSPQSFPQTVHASTIVLPGAVRGKNIEVYVNGNRIGGIQSAELEATIDGEVERELGNSEIVGRVVNGTDTNGSLTIRSTDVDAFFDVLNKVTGVSESEVFGWFNDNTVDLQIKIKNPKDVGTTIKTLRVTDAKFQPPGTPARVNAATDFAVNFESLNGTFREVKGDPV